MSNSKRRRAGIATLPARLLMAAGCARALSGAAFATDFAWTSPVSGNFSNVGLWTPMGAPSGAGDTALIGLAGAYTVTIDAHLAIGSLTLDALGATLAATGRTIDMQDLFTLSQGTVAFTSSTLVGAGSLRVDGGAFLARGASAFNSAAENNGLFWVNGVNGAGHATLTLNSAFTNGGTLRMESQNISWNSNIAMGAGGSIVNQAGGLIEVNPGTGGARTISGGTLQNAGSIATNAALLLSGVAYEAAGGTIGASHIFTNSTITVSGSAVGGTTLHLQGANSLGSNNLADTALWVRGAGGYGHATLTLADGLTNFGTIRMESVGVGFDNTVQVAGGVLHNGASGALEVNAGAGGARTFVGSLVNSGLIAAQSGTLLNFTDGVPFTVAHQGGLIDAQGEMRVAGGAFIFSGGDIAGTVRVVNGTIETHDAAGAGVVQAAGSSNLVANLGMDAVVHVRGGAVGGHATLGLTGDAENRGVIRMQSTDAGWRSNIDTGAHLLTNQAGARIEAIAGSGGEREFRGSLLNRGEIDASEGVFLHFVGADYTAEGGLITGDHAFSGASTLRTTASPALRGGSSTLVAVGGAVEFEGDVAEGYELWVRGANFGGAAATTMATDGASNRGVIRLESINAGWNSLLVLAGANFTNASGGLIDINAGSGGLRRISGDAFTFTNRGDITVEAGSTLEFTSTNGFTLRQAQGSIAADGLVDLIGGYLNYTGGDIGGSVRVSNGQVRVTGGVSDAAEIILAGAASALRENLSPTVTIWVQGNTARGVAVLTPDNPASGTAANLGTIRMESINSGWNSIIGAGPDTLLNGATGVIDVRPGSGGERSIAGTLRNQGLVTVQDGAFLTLSNLGYIGEGGRIEGNHAFTGASTLSFAQAAPQAHTLIISGGSNSVLTNITAGHDVWVRGANFGGAATLGLAANSENHGILRLESINAGWGSSVSVASDGRFTNAADGSLRVLSGSGGVRNLRLLLDNAGEAEFTTGATLTGDADLGSVINSGHWTMNTSGTVALNSSVATRTTFENTGAIAGVGTISIDNGAGSFVNSGLIEPGFEVGALAIRGAFEQTSTGVMAIDLAAPGTANGDRINITGAASLDGAVEVNLLGGYVPDWGDRWSILSFTSATGDLDVLTPTLADPLLRWWSQATATTFDIGVRHVADINHDDSVDFADLNLVLSFFNTSGVGLPGDANEDGVVDFADLNLVVSFFNTAAPANVPAPGALALAALGLMAGAGRRRGRGT